MQNNIPTIYISEIYCCIVKSKNLSTILEKLKHLCASLRSVLAISEYFMLI
jgi:hypothetical protein